MLVNGKSYRTIWYDTNQQTVKIIDQRWLPHRFEIATLHTLQDCIIAIKDMWVRGAPLIGAATAYGMALAIEKDPSWSAIEAAGTALLAARPTAVNLRWAIQEMQAHLGPLPEEARAKAAFELARKICNDDVEICAAIGRHGALLIEEIARRKQGEPVNILTHCNAGWLATVDWGTATSPLYHAHNKGIKQHIWVDETRPRNQGAHLTAWELLHNDISHTVIVDNAGGHLMQEGKVDMVIVGTDRTSANGDVCNKIGTYLKALAAADNNIPFYVALPSPTIDWNLQQGVNTIPIEERSAREVSHIWGKNEIGTTQEIQITPDGSACANPAFDVTPARLVTGLITERGVCTASSEGLKEMFKPDNPA